jgi:aromatic-L-amino-acid decarboxylase
MKNDEFRKYGHELIDWMADYLEDPGRYPVKPDIRPGDIRRQLPLQAPEAPEDFAGLFRDFSEIILPGMTHWQHPGFFAYFPANNSEPSILAEMLTATLGAQCMVWLTSPAAEELEERVMEWLRDMLGLPSSWTGVIQDSSSSATLVSLLTAREQKSGFAINGKGFSGLERYRVYTSTQGHSSIDKAVKIAGIGLENLVKVEVDDQFAMIAAKLEEAMLADLAAGFTPLAVVSTLGTTSSTAVDPFGTIGLICARYGCWHHIDASYAGTALVLPGMRWMSRGIEQADSFVVNPHKWMFTNFDCSAYFVKDKGALTGTFSILPEYLKTPEDKLVNNYRDWGIPLGRRFRALKLWFVIRTYGISGIRETISHHIAWAQWLKEEMLADPKVEIMAPVPLNLLCFRFMPAGMRDDKELDRINERILSRINASGKVLLTQTRLNGRYAIRFVAGRTHLRFEDIQSGWKFIRGVAEEEMENASAGA